MCGIFGYVGKGKAVDIVVEGLIRLDYRGHDSWGVSIASERGLRTFKKVGKIEWVKELDSLKDSSVGIGHTRWATHGAVNKKNAHPHHASDGSFVVAHNGIVENFKTLKSALGRKKYPFHSDTDTEVIVRLIESIYKRNKNLSESVRLAFKKLDGRNTIIVLSKDGSIIAARNGSPLVVGQANGNTYFSSDTLSFAPLCKKVVVVDNGQIIEYTNSALKLKEIKTGRGKKIKFENINIETTKIDKEGYAHFMLKEIHEAPYVIRQVLNQERSEIEKLASVIKKARRVYTLGSGTTGLAAAQIAYYLRKHAGINAVSLLGAESHSYFELFKKGDLIIAPSQSGETADVMEVLEHAKKKGVKIASYVNMPGSAMTRMSNFPFMANAGPEICVMSTKVFVSQISWGYLVAKAATGKYMSGRKNLTQTADAIERYLKNRKNHAEIKTLSRKLSKIDDIFLLGKSQNLQIVMEGMVKIIEGTYHHAHAIAAGDLKHYAITIIEKGVPVIFVISNDTVQNDVMNAVNEVKARGAFVVAVSPDNNELFDFHLKVPDTGETSAIVNVIPLQLMAYYMTLILGNDVDKPRNIAKSVTVK